MTKPKTKEVYTNKYAKSLAEFNKVFEPTCDYMHLIMEEFNEWFIEQDTKGKPEAELKELCDLLYVVYGYADSNKLGDIQYNKDEVDTLLKSAAEYKQKFPTSNVFPTFVATAYLYFITSRDFMWLYRLTQGIFAYAKHKGWPLEQAFGRVHVSNLSKLTKEGKVLRREDGKVLKSDQYKPAVLADLVGKLVQINKKKLRHKA